MLYLLLGLVVFLGVHSVRIFAEDWRNQTRTRLGEAAWKGLYSLVSLAGLALLIWGFGQARQQPGRCWAEGRWAAWRVSGQIAGLQAPAI